MDLIMRKFKLTEWMHGLFKAIIQWNARIFKNNYSSLFKVHEQDYLTFVDQTYHDSHDGICEYCSVCVSIT
jgi:hypothetical protein